MTISIDGEDVTDITIDGEAVTEVTIDGTVVWSSTAGGGGGGITVIDDFEDGDMAGWEDLDNMWGVVTDQTAHGTYAIRTATSSGGRFLRTTTTIHDDPGRNFVKPCRGYAFFRTDDASDGWEQLRFRIADTSNYWRCGWQYTVGDLVLETIENGSVVESDSDFDNGADAGQWYRLMIEIDDGNTFGRADNSVRCQIDAWDAANQEVSARNIARVEITDGRHANEPQLGAQVKATGQTYWLDYLYREI